MCFVDPADVAENELEKMHATLEFQCHFRHLERIIHSFLLASSNYPSINVYGVTGDNRHPNVDA